MILLQKHDKYSQQDQFAYTLANVYIEVSSAIKKDMHSIVVSHQGYKKEFVMRKWLGVLCVISAIWVVATAAVRAANDKTSETQSF